ncbi:MAG: hypothetical protein LBS00_04265 [Synergistaceae bacterium]|nr:hypothetical protein [Synergistaceae bacterium]
MIDSREWSIEKEINHPEDLVSEVDYLRLWTEVAVEGLRIADEARKGLGVDYLESINAVYAFDSDFQGGNEISAEWIAMPAAPYESVSFDKKGRIQTGVILEAYTRPRSPFLLRRVDGKLTLEKNGIYLLDVEFLPRPKYLDKKTSDGIACKHLIAQVGSAWLVNVPSQYCYYFKDGDECKFCNLVETGKVYHPGIKVKKPEQVAEALSIAMEENQSIGVSLCGGSFPGTSGHEQYIAIIRAIQERKLNGDARSDGSVPIDCIAGAPRPDELYKIDEFKKSGARFFQANLEIGDPKWFEAVCPGKAKAVGYENWIHALEYATEIFGKTGRVRSHLVAGIEPARTLLDAVRRLAEKGIIAWANPWKPSNGSQLENHRTPLPLWFFKLYDRMSDIYIHAGFSYEANIADLAPRNADISLLFNFWRVKTGIRTTDMWKGYFNQGSAPNPAQGPQALENPV